MIQTLYVLFVAFPLYRFWAAIRAAAGLVLFVFAVGFCWWECFVILVLGFGVRRVYRRSSL